MCLDRRFRGGLFPLITSTFCFLAAGALLAATEGRPFFQPENEERIRKEERIVLVGDALVEREQRYGYLETALLSRFPEHRLRFRNLGWNADTLEGLSRAYFDPPAKGTERLFEEIARQKPTMLFVGYGMAESLMAPQGAAAFQDRLGQFLDKAVAKTPISTFLFSPIQHENLGPPLPDPSGHQRALAAYTSAIGQVANDRKIPFVDLFTRMSALPPAGSPQERWTINGIHVSEIGYWRLALLIEEGLGLEPEPCATEISFRGNPLSSGALFSSNAKISDWRAENRDPKGDDESRDYRLEFHQTATRLPTSLRGMPSSLQQHPQISRLSLRLIGLPVGNYTLEIDDQTVASASAEEWGVGLVLKDTPQHAQAEALRLQVIRKNRLFFERYRPQNITYLLGFRAHEQGQNAKEIEALEALVAEVEEKIFELQKPKTHHFVLTRD